MNKDRKGPDYWRLKAAWLQMAENKIKNALDCAKEEIKIMKSKDAKIKEDQKKNVERLKLHHREELLEYENTILSLKKAHFQDIQQYEFSILSLKTKHFEQIQSQKNEIARLQKELSLAQNPATKQKNQTKAGLKQHHAVTLDSRKHTAEIASERLVLPVFRTKNTLAHRCRTVPATTSTGKKLVETPPTSVPQQTRGLRNVKTTFPAKRHNQRRKFTRNLNQARSARQRVANRYPSQRPELQRIYGHREALGRGGARGRARRTSRNKGAPSRRGKAGNPGRGFKLGPEIREPQLPPWMKHPIVRAKPSNPEQRNRYRQEHLDLDSFNN